MPDTKRLSAAQVIVLATELCSKGNFKCLQALQQSRPDILAAELCCRILLTFASGNEPPGRYLALVKQLRGVDLKNEPRKTIDISLEDILAEDKAHRRIRQIRLVRLKSLESGKGSTGDTITRFIIQQAYRIDAETGDLPTILQLVEPFIDESDYLRRWLISALLPLLRLNYEYYPEGELGLETIQALEGSEGVDLLLQRAKSREGKNEREGNSDIGRDLRGIVGPWMYGARSAKRRKSSRSFRRASIANQDGKLTGEDSGWQDVNEWILKTSLDDHKLTTEIMLEWAGPNDLDLGGYEESSSGPNTVSNNTESRENIHLTFKYSQAGLASIYATDSTSSETLLNCWHILERVTHLTKIHISSPNDTNVLQDDSEQPESIINLPRSELMVDALLDSTHPLTWPSIESLKFLRAILASVRILKDDLSCQQQLSCRSVSSLCLFGTSQQHRQELRKIMQNFAQTASPETDWHSTREKFIWLSKWGRTASSPSHSFPEEDNHRALFWRVTPEDVETETLTALLTAKQYDTAISLYLDSQSSPLPFFLTEKIVEHEILAAYDNASNGNRTRGGLKRASEILNAFSPHFPSTSPVNKIEHLLAATHSLSFYQLTLQHGVPFQPVSIRVHRDPISLIGKVLEQNAKAYTKLDDLLSIGRGLVAAGLSIPSPEEEPETTTREDDLENRFLRSDHRITYDAIISALSSNDFDTAYSYILTRLSPGIQPAYNSTHSNPATLVDDTSWRAAYAAGRHHLPPSSSTSAQITVLSKRMELLSLALTLVPDPSILPSILSTWQSCEEEFNHLRALEAIEEKVWDDRGDHLSSIPGGFGLENRDVDIAETKFEREKRTAIVGRGRLHRDEAPMGLFDVARGAARAIGKSAFPLRGGLQGKGIGDGESIRSSDESARSVGASGEEGQNRVRKRDMVSNMVTGGLVSGIGWVLGAQPVDQGNGIRDRVGSGSE